MGPIANGWASCRTMCVPIFLAALRPDTAGKNTRNSSPPSRATVSLRRTTPASLAATALSKLSPARWPCESLIFLNPSRSINSTASNCCGCGGAANAVCSMPKICDRDATPVSSSREACDRASSSAAARWVTSCNTVTKWVMFPFSSHRGVTTASATKRLPSPRVPLTLVRWMPTCSTPLLSGTLVGFFVTRRAAERCAEVPDTHLCGCAA